MENQEYGLAKIHSQAAPLGTMSFVLAESNTFTVTNIWGLIIFLHQSRLLLTLTLQITQVYWIEIT